MLLCDRCDNGYHMDCLNPPVENQPQDWLCPQCNGAQAIATVAPVAVRRPAALTLRVRQAVERNRQVALRESNAGRKRTRRKIQTKKRKVKRGGWNVNVAVIQPPRKKLSVAFGFQEKSSPSVAPPKPPLSLFGETNALMDNNE